MTLQTRKWYLRKLSCDVKIDFNSFALNSSLFRVSYSTVVMVDNMKDFARVLCVKLCILMKVKQQNLLNT